MLSGDADLIIGLHYDDLKTSYLQLLKAVNLKLQTLL